MDMRYILAKVILTEGALSLKQIKFSGLGNTGFTTKTLMF